MATDKEYIAQTLVNQYRKYEDERFEMNEEMHKQINRDDFHRYRRASSKLSAKMHAVKETQSNLGISEEMWAKAVYQWQVNYTNRNLKLGDSN